MFDFLDEQQADILCFQEFFHAAADKSFPTRDTLVQFLPTRYYHQRFTHSPRRNQYYGVIIFSRFPIIAKGEIPFETDVNNFCIYADLKLESDTVRVYNAHLQSIRFGSEDYAFVAENQNNEELKKGATRIADKLRRAFYNRQSQVERIEEHILQSPHPVILCGDFNDPPLSYTYEVFTDLLDDSFIGAGRGTGNTFNRAAFPTLRIDYVMHSREIQTLRYTTPKVDLSDHFPVVTELGI
jgi:endonuclease/exonuclease/phosphatase family metal-dependent hydrolase